MQRRSFALRLAAVVLLALPCSLAACRPGASGPPPRGGIVLVLLDTVRVDRLSAYGYERPTTPTLEALARRGTVFEGLQSSAPWTVPSMATLWTGLPPTVHGAGLEGELRRFVAQEVRGFDPSLPTLPRRLRELGYRTYGRIANELLDTGCFVDGFDEVEVARAPGEELVAWVEARMEEIAAGPFFLYLHLMDAHIPLRPPPELVRTFLPPGFRTGVLPPELRDAQRWGRFKKTKTLETPHFDDFRVLKQATYDAALRHIDDQLARLLALFEQAGVAEDTLFVVTSDHGEEFWDHFDLQRDAYFEETRITVGTGHGHTLFQELLHLPLVVAGPRVPQGRRVATRLRAQDLGSTLLAWAGGEPTLGEGESFAPLLAGRDGADRTALSESLCHGYELRALVDEEGYKLIQASHPGERDLLFDLGRDPGETTDLAAAMSARAQAMSRTLDEMLAAQAARRASAGSPIRDFDLDHLRDLGYVGESDGEDADGR